MRPLAVTLCKFFFEKKFLDEAYIPEMSDDDVRRAIAKWLGITRYDEVHLIHYNVTINRSSVTKVKVDSDESKPIV